MRAQRRAADMPPRAEAAGTHAEADSVQRAGNPFHSYVPPAAQAASPVASARSEERRVGKEC